MSNKKVDTLLKRIEKALEDLCEILEITHISAFIVDGEIVIQDLSDLPNQKINYYKGRERK